MRRIRSFVRRPGRITQAQRRTLETDWKRFGIEPCNGTLDLDGIFARHAPRYLEIGFGMGEALIDTALANPECDYLGVEVHEPGLGRLIHQLIERDIGNVRAIRGDAVQVLDTCIAPRDLAGVFLYFPDPWPKKRHHKRRLVQPDFVCLVSERLEPGGRFELATDWADYAVHMLKTLEAEPRLDNLAGPGRFSPRPAHRPFTRFERRGQRAGHGIWDLVFARNS
uniref:tRNA (guanine-N(7)-)-methyltransferase n=1 Tax=Candidatus Kentrum sp. FM TaxID=2126340 RepID=A0A450WRN7_9GAMM|nr:MAG: tRNA (guanine-N7-)-methyltransferase [Candidatus Kentron sp. FM]VFJ62991.1 MAG: tRNA (guanine-N7-)-methyltransferase [Candidatus Kentron sp. FM]VFK19658.1 MAG: tRNA (guanine-N7-)-methyltransferase [Candidatus Kentron sp. FM]